MQIEWWVYDLTMHVHICHFRLNCFPFVSRLLWWLTSHPERLQWTCRGTWRPMSRKGPKRLTGLLWGRDCWSLWMTWICQRYLPQPLIQAHCGEWHHLYVWLYTVCSSRWIITAHNSLLHFWSCYWTEEAYMTEGRTLTTKSLRILASLLPWERQEVGGMRWIHALSHSSVSSASPSLRWSLSTLSMLPFSKATPEWVSLPHIDQYMSESQSSSSFRSNKLVKIF